MLEVVWGKVEKSGSIRFSLAAASRLFLTRGMSFDFLGSDAFCLYEGYQGKGSIFKKGQSYCANTKKYFDRFQIPYQNGNVEVEFTIGGSRRVVGEKWALPIRYFVNGLQFHVNEDEDTLFDIPKPSSELLGPDRGETTEEKPTPKERPSEQLSFGFAPELRTFIDAEGSLRFSPQVAKKLKLEKSDECKSYVSVYFSRLPGTPFPMDLIVHSKPVPGSFPVFKKGTIFCIQLAGALAYQNLFDFKQFKAFFALAKEFKSSFKGHSVYRLKVEEYLEREAK